MGSNIEKESRIMLTHEEYILICADILKRKPHARFFTQTNYYFDEDYYLTDHHMMLRVRTIDKKNHEITLKIKGEDGDKENNQTISARSTNILMKKGVFPHGEVYDALTSVHVLPKNLKLVTSLYTRRLQANFDGYILAVDLNRYGGIEDFNLEIESNISLEHAKEILKQYCEQYQLNYQEDYIVKSARAINLVRHSN